MPAKRFPEVNRIARHMSLTSSGSACNSTQPGSSLPVSSLVEFTEQLPSALDGASFVWPKPPPPLTADAEADDLGSRSGTSDPSPGGLLDQGFVVREHTDTPQRLMALRRTEWFTKEYGNHCSGAKVHGVLSVKGNNQHVVTFVGVREYCDKALARCAAYLKELFEDQLILTADVAGLLQKTAKGHVVLENFMSKYPCLGYAFHTVPVTPGKAVLLGASQSSRSNQRFLQDIADSLKELSYDVPITHVTSDSFQALVQALETDFCVRIVVHEKETRNLKTASVHGLAEDVRQAWAALVKFSKDNEVQTQAFEFLLDDERALKRWNLFRNVAAVLLDITETRGERKFVVTCTHHRKDAEVVASAVTAVQEQVLDSVGSVDLSADITGLEKCLLAHGLETANIEALSTTAEKMLKDKFSNAVVIFKIPTGQCTLPDTSDLFEMPKITDNTKLVNQFKDKMEVLTLDITAVKADAVVCQVDMDLDLKLSATGAAIAHKLQPGALYARLIPAKDAAGNTAQFSFVASPGHHIGRQDPFKVFLTRTSHRTNFPFKAILSVVLTRNVSPEIYKVELIKVTMKCLEIVEIEQEMESVVLPPLGYGRLFGYRDTIVVPAMVEGVLLYLQHCSIGLLKKIYFAVNDHEELATLLLKEINDYDEENATMAPKPAMRNAGKDTRRQAVAAPGKVEAVVYTKKPGHKHQAMEALKEMVLKQLLHSETVPELSVVRELPDEVKKRLKEWSRDVFFSLDTDSNGKEILKIEGPISKVQEVKTFLTDEIFQHLRSEKEQLQVPLPAYWKLAAKGTVRRAQRTVLADEGRNYLLHKLGTHHRQEMERVVNGMWKPTADCCRKDAASRIATSVKIIEAYRLENPETWEKYAEQKARFLRKLKEDNSCTSIEKLKGSSGGVLTQLAIDAEHGFLHTEMIKEINECYLFHGHPEGEEVRESIAKTGLDPRLSRQGLHGFGIYTAENAAKADVYTGSGRERSMVLVRVILGRPCVVKDRQQFSRPPCTACLQVTCPCRAPHYDSVLFDSPPLPREFIIYDSAQCYPEYFMTYTTQ